ncbi:MAG: formyltetrahydrofolate deformylase [Candidatus Cyclonatronum sp.]|uniref:formyltetrahydrofolate deformylase n=1 Tax=Cyclonatronum sp. TaxID=3024185 RepID=UPI0025BAB8C2|nr:formyltetrahydrofolate deformylase [Cyclonatronum sp.]MCH8487948.1 formyltetrahydrofolate deformylase [Cyclonatronum sp.]
MSPTPNTATAIFLIQCPDQRGLVASISGFFFQRQFNILSCQQYSDLLTGNYFMRIEVALADLRTSRKQLETDFEGFGQNLKLSWSVHYTDEKQRVAVLVSKTSHCLYDLMLRWKEDELDCDIPLIISNHPDLEAVANQFKVPFHCLPVTAATKPEQEQQIRRLLETHHVDLVVLARYMQVLSPEFVRDWNGRVINIHHAFLPAFQGANPYQRAYERGVKMIGATAHYATEDLDEGPIIEQDVQRVMHEETPAELKQIGRDVERIVLSRAVQAHLERRIIVSGRRTIIFRG